MIRGAGMRLCDQQHAAIPTADRKWPLQRPNWNNQDEQARTNMADLRYIIIQGIKEAVPRGQNISKALKEEQQKDESPTVWLERLRKSLQLYSGIDPSIPAGQTLLKTQFVAKSWVDIHKKLEKLEDWQSRPIDELLREAQKVFVRREENQKKQARLLVAAVKEGQRGAVSAIRRPVGKGIEKFPARGSKVEEKERRKEERECFYCKRRGHLKKDCRKRIQDKKKCF